MDVYYHSLEFHRSQGPKPRETCFRTVLSLRYLEMKSRKILSSLDLNSDLAPC